MLAAQLIVAVVSGLVRPSLNALAVLQVVLPHAFIHGSVYVLVSTTTVGLVVGPVALVNVTVNMDELSLSMGLVVPPVSNIPGAIRPNLLSCAVTESTLPLASILSLGIESVGVTCLTRGIGVPVSTEGLTSFFPGEVLAAAQLVGLHHFDLAAG